jgi:glycosyltransferase involved in cell wall biosynthesis
MSDGFVCITDTTEKSIAELKLRNPKTWVVRNAIDVDRFTELPNKPDARRILNLPAGTKLLGTVCRLVREKGCADVLTLLSQMQEDWHLVIAGDGPLRSELERKAGELRIRSRVHFLGFIDDPRLVYAAIDAFVLAIRSESFGIAIAEAMASEVPVFLLGGEGGYREPSCPLVTPSNAVVVERRNTLERYCDEAPDVIHELAEEIRRIQASPQIRGEMLKNAREWVAQHFSGSATANATALVYHAALDRR